MQAGIFTRIDRYLLGLTLATLGSVVGILMVMMVLEHIPRLLQVTRLSGHRGYILGQTILGLLPEYAGIGIVVGIYFAVGMAIRKLALRGELSAIEAMGIAPARWMRVPLIVTLVGVAFMLVNQGWLMPFGERRLEWIAHRMATGHFGVSLKAGEFTELGGGSMLFFDRVDDDTGSLRGLLIADIERTYSASSGKLSIANDGAIVVQLANGQFVDHDQRRVLSFAKLTFRFRGTGPRDGEDRSEKLALRLETLDGLFGLGDQSSRSVAYSRLLWCLLVLTSCALAFILGRPPLRSASAIGLAIGFCLQIGFLKSIAMLEAATFPDPEMTCAAIAFCWISATGALFVWHQQAGNGAIDIAVIALIRRIAKHFQQRGKAPNCGSESGGNGAKNHRSPGSGGPNSSSSLRRRRPLRLTGTR
jgi:lipopolysaccharide export system permease protein